MLTDKQYLEQSSNCPFCGSEDVFASTAQSSGGSFDQHCRCAACEKEWTDTHELAGYRPEEGADRAEKKALEEKEEPCSSKS